MSVVHQTRPTDQPSAAARGGRARGRLARRMLAALVALAMVAVLGVGWLADSLGAVTPTASSSALAQQVGLARVTLTVSGPDQPGGGTLLLRVTDVAGKPIVGAQAACALSMAEMGMSLPTTRAQPMATPGAYRCAAPGLMPGAWTLALTLTPPGGETGHTTFQFVVA